MNEIWNLPVLPQGWVWINFESISRELKAGGTPLTKVKKYYDDGTIPFVKIEDIVSSSKYLYDTKTRITEQGLRNSSAWLVPRDSLLYSMYASYGEPIINKIEVTTSQAIIAYVPPQGLIILDYVYYYLKKVRTELTTRGTTQKNLNAQIVRRIPIPLAPFNEQVRIVAKLEELFTRLDAGVEGLRKVKAQLKRYRQAVLKYAFEGKLTEEWRKAHKDRIEHAQVLLEKIEKKRISRNPQWKSTEPINPKDLPEIPDDWIWVRAQEVCENITNGYTPSASELHASKGEIPFIKINNLTFTGKLDFSKNKTFIDTKVHETLLKRSKVFPGDVLINIVGPPLGKVSIVPNLYPEWNINQAIVFFRPVEGYDRDFLALCLQTRTIASHLTNQAKATAGQFNISVNMSRNLPIPLSSQEEQKEIVLEVTKHLDAMESAEIALCNSLSKAHYLRNSILKSAFLGKLVPQDQNDEPAEKLLERIKVERIKRHSEGSVSSSHRKLEIDNQVELSRYVK